MAKPWVAINLLNNSVIGRYETELDAARSTMQFECVDISYRPRKKKVKKEFPYV